MLRRRDLFPRYTAPPTNKNHFYLEISGPLC